MGVLQVIYKKYTEKYNFDASGDHLGIIRKLILSNNKNEDLCVNNECRIEYHGHTYTYCVMDDEDICQYLKILTLMIFLSMNIIYAVNVML